MPRLGAQLHQHQLTEQRQPLLRPVAALGLGLAQHHHGRGRRGRPARPPLRRGAGVVRDEVLPELRRARLQQARPRLADGAPVHHERVAEGTQIKQREPRRRRGPATSTITVAAAVATVVAAATEVGGQHRISR